MQMLCDKLSEERMQAQELPTTSSSVEDLLKAGLHANHTASYQCSRQEPAIVSKHRQQAHMQQIANSTFAGPSNRMPPVHAKTGLGSCRLQPKSGALQCHLAKQVLMKGRDPGARAGLGQVSCYHHSLSSKKIRAPCSAFPWPVCSAPMPLAAETACVQH